MATTTTSEIVNSKGDKAGEDETIIHGNPTSYDRDLLGYTRYCFDIVNIHPSTGVIKMFRFGAGADRTYTPA